MHWMQFILPLIIPAFTGWFVIWLTTWYLFKPYKQINVAGFKVQGIIPANQQLISENTGRLVNELFSFDAIKDKVTDPANFNKLKPEIEMHIDSFLRERLKDSFPMLSMLIGEKTISQLKTAFMLELESLFPVIMKSYINRLEDDLDLENLVAQKISTFPIQTMEELVYRSANKQLKKLQLLGAIIGLLMGCIHLFINTQFFH